MKTTRLLLTVIALLGVILACKQTDQTPTPTPAPGPEADYGDADDPDFPSLFVSNGARALDITQFWLGLLEQPSATTELDARIVDLDELDDGLESVTFLGLLMQLTFRAVRSSTVKDGIVYFNLLVDANGNGVWQGRNEWPVVNQEIFLPAGGSELIEAEAPVNTLDEVWIRATLTNTPVDEAAFPNGWDGTGEFKQGEVEDYLITPPIAIPPTETPTPKPPPYTSIIVVQINADTYEPVPNAPMYLFDRPGCQGTAIATGQTDPSGVVDFKNLQPTTYSVQMGSDPVSEDEKCQDVDLSQPDSTSGTAGESGPPDTTFPPAGEDTFNSAAQVTVDLGVLGTDKVIVLGPTTIKRSDPEDPGDGRDQIQTEIISMDLTGTSALLGPITVRLSLSRQSRGQVQQQNPGVDFPADSFFDVFFEIETPLGTLHNEEPVRMQAYDGIIAFPPLLRPYLPSLPACVTLYSSLNISVGCIQHAIHIPVPPHEKIVIFTSRPISPPKPTPTLSAAQEIPCGQVWTYYGSGFTPNGQIFKSFTLPGGVIVTGETQADSNGNIFGSIDTFCNCLGMHTLSAVDPTGQEAWISVNVVP